MFGFTLQWLIRFIAGEIIKLMVAALWRRARKLDLRARVRLALVLLHERLQNLNPFVVAKVAFVLLFVAAGGLAVNDSGLRTRMAQPGVSGGSIDYGGTGYGSSSDYGGYSLGGGSDYGSYSLGGG